jgi:hypothetical protein
LLCTLAPDSPVITLFLRVSHPSSTSFGRGIEYSPDRRFTYTILSGDLVIRHVWVFRTAPLDLAHKLIIKFLPISSGLGIIPSLPRPFSSAAIVRRMGSFLDGWGRFGLLQLTVQERSLAESQFNKG